MPTSLAPGKIPFTIRESLKARRMRLIVHASGLEVVVPRGVRRQRVEQFVEANREWAMRTLTKVRGRVPFVPQHIYQDLPLFSGLYDQQPQQVTAINLRSIGRVYAVNYVRVPMLRGRATLLPQKNSRSRQLNIYCANPDTPPQAVVADLLREWLREKAKTILPDTVNSIADEIGIKRPTQIRLGFQRTVWGSRSATGRISLNVPLLFFPPDLLRHVIIHELCHTIHMDHSAKFQKLLKQLDPDSDRLSQSLNRAEIHIPPWVHG